VRASPDPLASDILAGLDPVRLARRAGLAPDPWQEAALRSRAPRSLWNCCRQSGKTSVAAVLAVHQALYTPGSLVLLVSPSLRQSQEGMAKVAQVYAAAGRAVPAETENKLTLELASGSRIVALPGSERTTRGYSAPALIIIDEASRVDDELYHALTPMLATNPAARVLAMSTPNGVMGWWFQCWEEGGALWERVRVPATECPRISPAFLEVERASMPYPVFAQEYECAFSQLESGAFRYEDLMAMLSDDITPRFPLEPAGAGAQAEAPPPAAGIEAYLTAS
jgi:hypothetical protein